MSPQERLTAAKWVYAEMAVALREAAGRLRAGSNDPKEDTARAQALGVFFKQLQQIHDLEGSLGKLGKDGSTALDLGAARDEIRTRLARLRERS